jgi:arylsulfatase A-like enzyme
MLLCAITLAGCTSEPADPEATPSTPNILLVTVDTLRADHLGCYGYFRDTSPNIDRLAAESVVFERAYCPMATTLPSHASLLTGLNPLEHGVLANQEHGGDRFRPRPGVRSVAEFLRDAGYATGAFVSAAPIKRTSGISAGFDTFVEPEGASCRAEVTTRAALDWIASHAGRRMFAWVHVYDPHWPRTPPAPYLERYRNGPDLDAFLAARRIPDAASTAPCKLATDTRSATNAYDGAIRYVDDQIELLLAAFRDRGLMDRTIVVLTADHGEGLNQHDWPAHGRIYDEQLRVPLLIRFPGHAPDRPARFEPTTALIDVFPTILAGLDLPATRGFLEQASGLDVLSSEFRERPVLAQRTGRDCGDDAGPMYAWATRRFKYLHQPRLGDRLYDLAEDPHELNDLLGLRPEFGATLLADLLAAVRKEAARGDALDDSAGNDEEPLDPRIRAELDSLGYLGGGRPIEEPSGEADSR